MPRPSDTILHLELPSETESIARAVHRAEETVWSLAWGKDDAHRVGVVISEAVANAVEHGNNNDPDKLVKVSAEGSHEAVWFTIEDEGTGIRKTWVEHADLPEDELAESGRGLYLIRELSESYAIDQEGRRLNVLFKPRGLNRTNVTD